MAEAIPVPDVSECTGVEEAISRAWPNVRAMLQRREMDVSGVRATIDGSQVAGLPMRVRVSHLIDGEPGTVVIFMGGTKIGVKQFRDEVSLIEAGGFPTGTVFPNVVFVSLVGATIFTNTEIAKHTRSVVQVYLYADFFFCFATHDFVRHHRIIRDSAEKKAILHALQVTEAMLPRYALDDPYVAYHALGAGTLVVNMRQNGTDDPYPYYRIVGAKQTLAAASGQDAAHQGD